MDERATASGEADEADAVPAMQPVGVAAETAAGQDVVEEPSAVDLGRALWTYRRTRTERDEEGLGEVVDATAGEALRMQRCVCVGCVKHWRRRADVHLRYLAATHR